MDLKNEIYPSHPNHFTLLKIMSILKSLLNHHVSSFIFSIIFKYFILCYFQLLYPKLLSIILGYSL